MKSHTLLGIFWQPKRYKLPILEKLDRRFCTAATNGRDAVKTDRLSVKTRNKGSERRFDGVRWGQRAGECLWDRDFIGVRINVSGLRGGLFVVFFHRLLET